LVCCRRLRRKQAPKRARPPRLPAAAPTPIPALAPVDRDAGFLVARGRLRAKTVFSSRSTDTLVIPVVIKAAIWALNDADTWVGKEMIVDVRAL
jgi:hypothetical protein